MPRVIKRLLLQVFLLGLLAGCGRDDVFPITWHMVNVNSSDLQGDANILEIGDRVILIDAGYAQEAEENLIPYLRSLGIDHVNDVFISHPHRDHYEGVRVMLKHGVTIDTLYLRMPPKEICDREIPWGCNYSGLEALVKEFRQAGVAVIEPAVHDTFDLPQGSALTVLHAQPGDFSNDTIDVNDLSLVMRWEIGDFRVLFTGDLNQKVGSLLSNDNRMKSDFMKMPHHGASSLAPNSFFDAVDPNYVLVPGPRWVWCGERGERARRWTESNQLPTWVNGIDGNVRVEFYEGFAKVIPQFTVPDCRSKAFGVLRTDQLSDD